MKPSLNNVRLRDKIFADVFPGRIFANSGHQPHLLQRDIRRVRERRIQDITVALEQMKNEFRREVEDALEISSVFYTDIQLNEIMETVYDHPADYIEAYDTYLRRILNSARRIQFGQRDYGVCGQSDPAVFRRH